MKKSLIFIAMLVLAVGFASAMSTQDTNSPLISRFTATADVLYDQTDNPSGNGAPDQLFEATYAAYSSEGADDFEVTGGAGWDVDGVNTDGTGGGSIHVNATFYDDAGGLPGAVLCEYLTVTSYVDAAGALEITLPSVCSLGAGVVWYAQEVRQDFGSAGQHFWSNRLTQNGNEAVWKNPGNGFGTGCLDWTPMTVCGVGGGTNPDFLFQILGPGGDGGDGGGGTPPATPAVGPFGLLLMVLALGGGSGYVLARRR